MRRAAEATTHSLESQCLQLKARAERLLSESRAWAPIDVARRAEREEAQHALLWDMAVWGGGLLMNLATRRQLDTAPRLRTLALQTRAEIRRFLDAGELPWDHAPVNATGLDVLVVQLFHACCNLWLHVRDPHFWYFREIEVAALYARFMTELAEHLRAANATDPGPTNN